MIIDGKGVAARLKCDLKKEISEFSDVPGLGIILVGDRPDSKIYVNKKKEACNYVGIKNYDITFSENVTSEEIIVQIKNWNDDHNVSGILVQLPLPKHLDTNYILSYIDIKKDVDGFHCVNMGKMLLNENCIVPCTPRGCMELLDFYSIPIKGKNAVIVGRSKIVGIPMALFLMHRNATVTICHSYTKNLKEITKNADIIIMACGKPLLLKKDYIKENVVVLDVGINKVNNKIVGDADFEDIKEHCEYITPVPGGIGPMTIVMLLKNTIQLYKQR